MLFSDYQYRVRRLLRDAQGIFWDNTQLGLWINKARDDTALLTGCTRNLVQIPCVAGQEFYSYGTVLAQVIASGNPAQSVNQILQISFLPNPSLRYPLRKNEFSRHNNLFRQLATFQGWPTVWAPLGYQQFSLMPIPSSNAFSLEVDNLYTPSPLVNQTDMETAIPDPWADLVPLRAAKWCKYYEEAYQDADVFEARYIEQLSQIGGALPQFAGGLDFS
jgi:hypothetical protein